MTFAREPGGDLRSYQGRVLVSDDVRLQSGPALSRRTSAAARAHRVHSLSRRSVVSDAVSAAQASLYSEAMVNAMRGDCTNRGWR
jgi:hypothetical protein